MSFATLNTFIESTDAKALASLREKYGELNGLFSVYKELGDEDAVSPPDPQQISAMLELADNGTKVLRDRYDGILTIVRNKMRLSFLIKQSGAYLAILAGVVSAFLSFSKQPQNVAVFTTAVVTAIGGLVAALSDTVIRSPSGLTVASPDEYSKLVSLRIEVEEINQKLTRIKLGNATAADSTAILDKLDQLSLALLRYTVA